MEVTKLDIRFVDDYINKKLNENDEFIRYTFYELRVKNNLSQEDMDEFLKLNRTYFERKGYKVYVTDDKFMYNDAKMTVQLNELMIIIKDDESRKKR